MTENGEKKKMVVKSVFEVRHNREKYAIRSENEIKKGNTKQNNKIDI